MVAEAMSRNRILAGLPFPERDVVAPSCEVVSIHLGDVLDEARRPIQFLHFPVDAAISVTSMEGHQHVIEVALTGREGSSGSSVVQGDDRSMCTAIVQIPGTAIRLPTSVVLGQLPRLPYLEAALSRHNLLLMRNAVISVGCGNYHRVPQRLARWLKTHWHRTGIDTFPFSAEFLSAQVGTDPKLVREALEDFETQGLIKVGRNKVTIADHDRLAKQACECYELAKKATEEYIAALADIARAHGGPSGGSA